MRLWPTPRRRFTATTREDLSYAYDACAPVKVAHAVAERAEAPLFMPKIVALDAPVGEPQGAGAKVCANEQAVPDVVSAALGARGKVLRLVAPVVDLGSTGKASETHAALRAAARALGADPGRALTAARRARQRQARYEQELLDIGSQTLRYARAHDVPVVLVCGSLHVIVDDTINAGIPSILRNQGVLALPMDCMPVPNDIDALERVPWAEQSRALRCALAARAHGDVFPLLLSAFACGPASFGEQLFERLMAGYPHTAL